MAEAEAEDNKPAVDPRIIWLRQRICSVLRCKEDRVERLLGNEESAAAVSAFLDGAELNRLLVYDSGKGELAAVRAPAAARRARSQGGRSASCAWLTSAASRYAPRAPPHPPRALGGSRNAHAADGALGRGAALSAARTLLRPRLTRRARRRACHPAASCGAQPSTF